SEFQNMLADGAHLEIIFSMNVRGETSAQGCEHRTGNDRRPPTLRLDVLPELLKRDARLGSYLTGNRIPVNNFIHARHVEHDAASVERGVIVTAPRAACSNGESGVFCKLKSLGNFFRAFRFEDVSRRAQ